MTPEEIIKQLRRYNIYDAQGTNDKAIEAIKAYAREMCDKQREECVELMPDHLHSMEVYEVLNAPYPKELQ